MNKKNILTIIIIFLLLISLALAGGWIYLNSKSGQENIANKDNIELSANKDEIIKNGEAIVKDQKENEIIRSNWTERGSKTWRADPEGNKILTVVDKEEGVAYYYTDKEITRIKTDPTSPWLTLYTVDKSYLDKVGAKYDKAGSTEYDKYTDKKSDSEMVYFLDKKTGLSVKVEYTMLNNDNSPDVNVGAKQTFTIKYQRFGQIDNNDVKFENPNNLPIRDIAN